MKIKSQRLVIQVGTSMGGTAFSSGRRQKSKEGAILGKKKGSSPVQKQVFQRGICILFDAFSGEYWHGTTSLYTAFLAQLAQILSRV